MQAGLKDMGTGQVHQVLRMGIAMALYCQKDDWMYQMFHLVFVDNKVHIGYVNKAGYIQMILETPPLKSPLA